MSYDVEYNVMRAEHKMIGRSLDVWAVNLYSKLRGDLKEGYYYQTYF